MLGGVLHEQMGRIQKSAMDQSKKVIQDLPSEIHNQLRDPIMAEAFLLSTVRLDQAFLRQQQSVLNRYKITVSMEEIQRWGKIRASIKREHHFVFLKIAVGTLKMTTLSQCKKIVLALNGLASIDKKISRQELIAILYSSIMLGDGRSSSFVENITDKFSSAQMFMSYLIKMHNGDSQKINQHISDQYFQGRLSGDRKFTLEGLIHSLGVLQRQKNSFKEDIIRAGIEIIQWDSQVSREEYEFLQLLVECLGVPMPPLVVSA